jgi:hypothetical protein
VQHIFRAKPCEEKPMNAELITDWEKHDSSLRIVLALASRTLLIFDEDLSRLNLERPDSAEILRRFLASDINNRLQILVRNAEPFRRESPRLMKLLEDYPETMTVYECSPHLSSQNDAMLIADDRHALIRFHKDNVRSKIIIDNIEECAPYARRFEEITNEGGEQVSATTLGL